MEVLKILKSAVDTFEERGKTYGKNYINSSLVKMALFPNGVVLKTPEDHARFDAFNMIICKISRYAANWEKGGHQDSVHDAINYCAILESIDSEIKSQTLFPKE